MRPPMTGMDFVAAALVMASVLAGIVFLMVRARRARSRPRWLASMSLACGISALFMPENLLRALPAWGSGFLIVFGALRLAIGLAGVGFGIAALVQRDAASGSVRPAIGIGLSFLHAVMGIGLFWFSLLTHPAAPWIYESPKHVFRLTLPSKEWRPVPAGNQNVAAFRRLMPQMQVWVPSLKRGQSAADYTRVVDAFNAHLEADPRLRGRATQRDGITASADPYHFTTVMDSTSDRRSVLVAYSATWLKASQTVVEVMFEGLPFMTSQVGKDQEMAAMTAAAQSICLSVQ